MNDQTREIYKYINIYIYKDSIEIFQKLKKENQYIYIERVCVDIKYGGREKRVLIKNIPETVPNILDTKWSSPYCLFIVLIKRVRVRVYKRQ